MVAGGRSAAGAPIKTSLFSFFLFSAPPTDPPTHRPTTHHPLAIFLFLFRVASAALIVALFVLVVLWFVFLLVLWVFFFFLVMADDIVFHLTDSAAAINGDAGGAITSRR